MKQFIIKNKLRIVLSAVFSILLLFACYLLMNSNLAWGSEKDKMKLLETLRTGWSSIGKNQEEDIKAIDSLMLIDVHYDKCMRAEGGDSLRMVATPNREKLLQLLQYLQKNNDYKYIMLDILFVKALSIPSDSALHRLIASMDRIVIPYVFNEEIADSCLLAKTGSARYNYSSMDDDFQKYPYVFNGIKSVPLKMYEEMTGNTIDSLGCFYYDNGLVRKSLLLTYETLGVPRGYEDIHKDLLGKELLSPDEDGETIFDTDSHYANGKYVLIGDFEDDRHGTYMGKLSGPIINYCAYIALLHGHHRMSMWLSVIMFVVFFVLSFLALGMHDNHWWWVGYPLFLALVCIFTYCVMGEVYEIFVTTLFFYALRSWKDFVNCGKKARQGWTIVVSKLYNYNKKRDSKNNKQTTEKK